MLKDGQKCLKLSTEMRWEFKKGVLRVACVHERPLTQERVRGAGTSCCTSYKSLYEYWSQVAYCTSTEVTKSEMKGGCRSHASAWRTSSHQLAAARAPVLGADAREERAASTQREFLLNCLLHPHMYVHILRACK